MSRPSVLRLLVLGRVVFVLGGDARALDAQPGSPVPCVEGPTTGLAYYDHASCQIDVAGDTDGFAFAGNGGGRDPSSTAIRTSIDDPQSYEVELLCTPCP